MSKKLDIVRIQETMMELIDQPVANIYGVVRMWAFFQSSVGLSGELLTLWDRTQWEVVSSKSLNHALVIQGKGKKSGVVGTMANVYAPCDSRRKKDLWIHLRHIVNNSRRDA